MRNNEVKFYYTSILIGVVVVFSGCVSTMTHKRAMVKLQVEKRDELAACKQEATNSELKGKADMRHLIFQKIADSTPLEFIQFWEDVKMSYAVPASTMTRQTYLYQLYTEVNNLQSEINKLNAKEKKEAQKSVNKKAK